jgi:flagellar biosynthesis GTPase FlhF
VSSHSAPPQNDGETRVYRGKSLEEVLPKVKQELGPDALIIRRRDGLVGGVGGFFQRPFVEIEARPGLTHVDVRDEEESLLPELDEGDGYVEAYDEQPQADDLQDTQSFEPDLPGAFELELERADSEAAAWAAAEPLELQQFPDASPVPPLSPAEAGSFMPPLTAQAPAQHGEFMPPPAPFVPPAHEALTGEMPAIPTPAEPPTYQPPAPSGRPIDFMPSRPASNGGHPLIAALAVEEPFATEAPSRAPAPSTPAARAVSGALAAGEQLREPREQRRATAAEPLVEELRDAGMSGALARSVLAEASEHGAPFAPDADLRELTRQALAGRIVAAAPSSRVIAFVGAGGAGKSLCAERLAAAYAEGSALPVVYVALGTDADAAARTLLPLAVPVVRAETAAEASAVIREQRDRALVVIDTATPGDAEAVSRLADELQQIDGVEVHLTLPATLSRRAAEDLLYRLDALQPTRLALTHADETAHLGPVVDVALAADIPISYVVDADLRPAQPQRLAEGLLP